MTMHSPSNDVMKFDQADDSWELEVGIIDFL